MSLMATFGDQPAGHHDLALREQALVAYGDGQLWQRTRERWDVLREEIAEERHIQAHIRLYTCLLALLDAG